MADTITIPATGSGTATPVVATDDAGAAGHVQVVKLAIATDGSATAIPGTAATGLYVNPTDSALRDNGKIDIVAIDQYTPGQQLMAASLPVVIASNQGTLGVTGTFWQATQPVSGTFWQATQPVSGTFWQATQPISGSVTATQGTGTNLHAVLDSGTLTTVSTVTAVTTCNLAVETTKVIGTVRNVGNIGAIFDAPTASTVPANIIYNGLRGATTVPTAVTDGQTVGVMGDKYGRTVVQIGAPRDLLGIATLDSSSGTTVSFITAGAASVFNDISTLVITNDSATATIVSMSDNGAAGNIYKFAIAANGGISVDYNPPLPQGTAAAAWQVLNSAAVSLHYHAVFQKNK